MKLESSTTISPRIQLTENLIIIFGLTSLQRSLRFLQFPFQRFDIRIRPFKSGLFDGLFEIGYGRIVFLEVKVNPCPCAEGFERGGREE